MHCLGKPGFQVFSLFLATYIARLTLLVHRCLQHVEMSIVLWGGGGGKVTWYFMLKERWAWLREVCQRDVVGATVKLPRTVVFYECNFCLWFVVSTVLVKNATCQYWLVIVRAVIFSVLLQSGVKWIMKLLKHRALFVDLSSWMLADDTFVYSLPVSIVILLPPLAALSQLGFNFSLVFVAAFSRSFIQFYLNKCSGNISVVHTFIQYTTCLVLLQVNELACKNDGVFSVSTTMKFSLVLCFSVLQSENSSIIPQK